MKKIAIASLFLLFLIVATATAYTTTSTIVVDASVTQPKLFGVFSFNVPLGQSIEIQFKVKNIGSTPVLINKARVVLKDPSGNIRLDRYYTVPATTLNAGEERTFTIKTDVVADKEGIWTAKVIVYSNNVELGSDVKSFTVSKPPVNVEIVNIVGYAVSSAGIVGLALYLLRRGHYA